MAYEVRVAVAKAETRCGEVMQLADQRRGMMNQEEAGGCVMVSVWCTHTAVHVGNTASELQAHPTTRL
jgi:hypothetical protein